MLFAHITPLFYTQIITKALKIKANFHRNTWSTHYVVTKRVNMQKQNSHWYLSTSPVSVVLRSSWLLFPAIVTLLAFDVIESSIIAAHGDNSLTLLGFLLPIITLLSAIALAIAVRTNMVLVKEQQDQLSHIPSLLALSLLVGSFLMLLLYLQLSLMVM